MQLARQPVGSEWAEADLVRRLNQTLTLAERAVTILAPTGYRDPDDPDGSVQAEKVIGETALLLLAASPVGERDATVHERSNTLAVQLLPHTRSERIRVAVCLQPTLARDYAFAHCCLARLGYIDPSFDRLLAVSLQASEAVGRERLPYLVLEQAWLARVWNPDGGPTVVDRGASARSILGRSMDTLIGTRDDLYALTHALLYVTDLGARRPRLPRPGRVILADAEAALARCMDADDFDLAGELLMAWPLLRQPWSPAASFSFRVVARVEDEVGFLPAPITRKDRYEKLQGEDRTRYALATLYHTAYVMGLLCAVILRSGSTRPGRIERPQSRPGSAAAVLASISEDGRTRQWLTELACLNARQQDALAPWLLTIALQRAVARSDLGQVRDLLELGVRYEIAGGPVPRQAAGLLRRAAMLGSTSATW